MKILFILTLLSFSCFSVADDEKVSLPIEELKTFNDIFLLIKQNYVEEISDKELIHSAIKGMLSGLDPHSAFLENDDFEDLSTSTSGRFGGIGIEVTMKDGFLEVISPIKDTPAYSAGILSGDLIIKVDEQTVRGLDLDDALRLIRGEPDSDVTLTIIREQANKPLNFTLTRQFVKTVSVSSKMLEDNFAYVSIAQFQLPTGKDLRDALSTLQDTATINGLILDLRGNPGGVLTGAINVSDLFLNSGIIVSTKGRNKNDLSTAHATPGDVLNGKPIVVLINLGSASASEIVAGALQDHKRAIIMGNTSFGKGSVQSVLELNDTTAVKLTTARYYTPKDISIQAKGITPDILVKPLQLTKTESTSLKITEASLSGHLENEKLNSKDTNAETKNLATKDYVLYEALNLLKGLDVINKY